MHNKPDSATKEIAYKLLDQELFSNNGKFQWEIGKTYTIEKPGNKMCSSEVFHCYNHPILAVLLNPLHGNIENPRLFEIEVPEFCNNDGLKYASKSQTLIKEIPLPDISDNQRIEFAIKVVKLVRNYNDYPEWNAWADRWLNGEDQSNNAAWSTMLLLSIDDPAYGVAQTVHWYGWDKKYAIQSSLKAVRRALHIYKNNCFVVKNEDLIEIAETL